jgi:cytochrome c oxidase assembly protein subunit 15
VRSFRLSPFAYRRITLAALAALAMIIVTGGAVRVTGSGLGCPQWPNCESGSLVPRGATGVHGTVEWANRLFTGVVSVAVVLAVLGSLVRRPRRRDLTWLSLGLVAGVVAQIVLGGLTVIFELAPPFVMAHFLVSLLLVADAVLLHNRAGLPDGGELAFTTGPEVRAAARWLLAAAAAVVVSGTVVTGAGPHGGDDQVRRLDLLVPDVARVHGIAVNLLVAATLFALWLGWRGGGAPAVARSLRTLLVVEVAQGAIGYTQYFTGVPEGLVALHIAGAVAVWIATLRVVLSLRASRPAYAEPAPAMARSGARAGAGSRATDGDHDLRE